MKKTLLYWVPTALLCLMMMMSGVMYLLNQEFIAAEYIALGYPVYVMYFNAAAKLLGGFAIVLPTERYVKEFAYAGYLYICILAILAHLMVNDGKYGGALVALILWGFSYWQFRLRQCSVVSSS